MSTLEELTNISSIVFNPAIKGWKEEGKKVAGFFCTYVPEEIIYAAGILPYRVRPVGCTETMSADVYLHRINCSFVRSCLEYALAGKYEFLDGVVFENGCDHSRRLYDVWREKVNHDHQFVYLLQVPHKVTDESIAFFRDEIAKFRDNLEKHFGVEITESRLRNAIGVYNETRGLLKRLYDLRQRAKPPIAGAECLNVVLAATAVPRDRYNQLLTRLLEELEQREEIPDYKARLMIVGSLYDDPAYTEIIEELGGLVVTDGLCFGSRYFWEPVEGGADLLGALSKSYMSRPSCPRMTNTAPQRLDFVKEMIERFRVDGIILQRIRYCDVWGGELFHLRNKLGELGIPMLALEREYALGSTEQLRTRVEAFLETIGR